MNKKRKEYKLARIQLNPKDRLRLEEIALDCGSTDTKNRASLKQLFEDIGTGRLDVIPAVQIEEKAETLIQTTNRALFELTITVICDLNGTLAIISKIIFENGGELHQTIAQVSNDRVIIIFECGKGETEIIEAIDKIKFLDVVKYNGFDKRKHFVEAVNPKEMEAYRMMETEDQKQGYIATTIERYKDRKIVVHVEQSFYLQIEVKTQAGVFYKVMNLLAEKKISILSTSQHIDYGDDVGYINILAGVNISDYDKSFEGVQSLMDEIQDISNVKFVRHRRNSIFYQDKNSRLMKV